VVITIGDDGVGMTSAVMEKIFDPFFTTRPVGVGRGQGLSLAHNVISRYGGRINVHSEPGCGSRFTIHLPMADGQPESGGHEDPQLLGNRHRFAS
jgi:signal transduction histidine kinase